MASEVFRPMAKDWTSTLDDSLAMVSVLRQICYDLGDVEGVTRIHALLVEALGESGPTLLSFVPGS